jgi:sulfonate transport system substrate-binding protein
MRGRGVATVTKTPASHADAIDVVRRLLVMLCLWSVVCVVGIVAACNVQRSGRERALPAASASAVPPLGTLTLRVAEQAGLTRGALELAGELPAPYQIEWSTFAAGPPLLEALNADAVDIGTVGDSPPIFAQAAGAAIRIVGVMRNSPKYEVLLVPGGSNIHSVEQLKGKRVAVAKGSGAHHLLLAALRRAGLRTADIRTAYLTPNDAQPAFNSGDVDAWAVWDPFASNNLRLGARKLTDGEGLISGLGFQVTSQKALSNPGKLRMLADYLGRARRAQAWINSHRDLWAARYAELTKLSFDVTRDMFAYYAPVYVPIEDGVLRAQQELADAYLGEGLLKQAIVVRDIFDARLELQSSKP